MTTKKILVVIGLSLSASAHAVDNRASNTLPPPQPADASTHAYHVGLLGGYVDQVGSYKPTLGYGADVGFQPFIPFGLGVQYLRYQSDREFPGIPNLEAGTRRNELMMKVSYNFGGGYPVLRYAYIGMKAGVVFITPTSELAGVRTSGTSYTRVGLGPKAGFDIPVAMDDRVSLGFDASYLFLVGPEKGQTTFAGLGAIKYWF